MTFIVADFKDEQSYRLAGEFAVRYVPHYVIKNATGNAVLDGPGGLSKEQLRQKIEEGLK
jgi:thioredoxin-related protein